MTSRREEQTHQASDETTSHVHELFFIEEHADVPSWFADRGWEVQTSTAEKLVKRHARWNSDDGSDSTTPPRYSWKAYGPIDQIRAAHSRRSQCEALAKILIQLRNGFTT